MKKNQLKVDPIKNGTVIDHITAGKALQVADILDLNHTPDEVMMGMNLVSAKMGQKDIIKIENRELSPNEVNSIAMISPTASLIIINDYEVVKKFRVEIPDKVDDLIVCPNPNCITNVEHARSTFFVAQKDPIEVRCKYCEKKYAIEYVKFSI